MFILLTILQMNLKATHIIGGDISYQCLGGNQFQVTVTVFRDCAAGTAQLGNTLTIRAVNQSTLASTNWPLNRISSVQIPFVNAGVCAQANLCVEENIYQGTITLPNNTNGYDLQFNSCCRNGGVVNIANSIGASSRIHTIVPPPQLCNNSPTFSQQFSNILCVNVNGCIDLSANDPDGDQLVYRLAQPLNSGGNPLPYSLGFSLANTMNGNPNLTINSTTGEACVTPTQPGIFVATVEVDEIRSGVLIGQTRRDIQFVVVVCPQPVACFDLPDTICFNTPIVPDLSCMPTPINSYRWAIHEMNPPGPWIPVHYTAYLPGPIAVTDLRSYWNGYQAGKSYGISIDIFTPCGNATTYREVYIREAPQAQQTVPTHPLSCTDACITIGHDIESTFGPGSTASGAPFTVRWNSGATTFLQTVCPTEPTYYYATVRNRWGCPRTWRVLVDKDTCCLDPCFELPDTACAGGPIFPDLSCMQTNIDSYRWAIHEMNPPGPWIPKHYTPYLQGAVAMVDFTTLWNGFEPGKTYGISIDVFKNCGVNATIYREVYIVPHPDQQMGMPSFPLSCTDNCVTIGNDLSPLFGGGTSGTGAPFIVTWDDGSTNLSRTVCPSVPTTYQATITNRWGCSTEWFYHVDKDTCCLDPCFMLPDTVCEGDPIFADLSCMQPDIDSYRWAIHEMNPPGPWIPMHYTPYLPGPVTPIDFMTVWPGFQAGKTYGISIDVFKNCGVNATIYREVYVAHRPAQQMVMFPIALSCEDSCTVIGDDLVINFGPGNMDPGAPFTIIWDDGSMQIPRIVCPAEPTTYTATVRNIWGCESHWFYYVDKDTCCLDPCFELPDTLCENISIVPDLSCMQNDIDTYRWVIHEMNPPGPWIVKHATAYLNGPVAPVDFTSLWNGFEAGKSYGISIDVFKSCGANASIYREVYIAPPPVADSVFVVWCVGDTYFDFGSLIDSSCQTGIDSFSLISLTTGNRYPLYVSDPSGGWDFITDEGIGDLACFQFVSYKDGCVKCILNISLVFSYTCTGHTPVWCGSQLRLGKMPSKDASLKIIPNPSNALFRIKPQYSSTHISYDQVKVISTSGATVASYTDVSQSKEYDLSNLPAGIYIINVLQEGKLQTLKLVLID